LLAVLCTYLPAIAASSPIYEGRFGENVDNRLHFYATSQEEVPSVTGDVIPEYVVSLSGYRKKVIGGYSKELSRAGVNKLLLQKDWVNSRGATLRFDRKAVEIRVMDEQECIKADVALSCFIRASLRGLMKDKTELLPHRLLVKDFNSVVADGLKARVQHPSGPTAGHACRHFLRIAEENASEEERGYLAVIQKRIDRGNLSEIIRERVQTKARKTDFEEAVVSVYSRLIKSLVDNQPYF
jgi:hypothetical protein